MSTTVSITTDVSMKVGSSVNFLYFLYRASKTRGACSHPRSWWEKNKELRLKRGRSLLLTVVHELSTRESSLERSCHKTAFYSWLQDRVDLQICKIYRMIFELGLAWLLLLLCSASWDILGTAMKMLLRKSHQAHFRAVSSAVNTEVADSPWRPWLIFHASRAGDEFGRAVKVTTGTPNFHIKVSGFQSPLFLPSSCLKCAPWEAKPSISATHMENPDWFPGFWLRLSLTQSPQRLRSVPFR